MPVGHRSPHHLIPKMFKGREVVHLHPICHRKIHATWTERELKNRYHTVERILEHPDIQTFAAWVAGKPADFYERTEDARSKRRRRR
jgi:hypothetical protein